MRTSETIGQLAKALAAAQAEIGGAAKSSTNPHFRSRYADLSEVWAAWQAVGPKNGLSIVQAPGATENGTMALTTLLAHTDSGEFVAETLTIPLPKADPQGYGSAVTYARRYALAAMVGVCPEDDDGNAASRGTPAPRQEATPRITDDQRIELQGLIEASGANIQTLCDAYKVEALPQLTAEQFEHAAKILRSRLAERGRVAA